MHTLNIRGGIEHLLHAGTALRALVGDHHAVAALHLTAEDALTGIFLRVEADGRTLEVPQCLIDAGGLHHTAVLGDIAKEHGQATVLGIGVGEVADAAPGAVGIEGGIIFALRAHLRGEAIPRGGEVDGPGIPRIPRFPRNPRISRIS